MATIDRGQEYLYEDFIDNIIEILNDNKDTLGLKYIGSFKGKLVAKYPSAYVVLDHSEEEWHSMPSVKNIKIYAILYFYFRSLDQEVRKDEVNEALGKIAFILRKNHSCNGFLNTPEGLTVEDIDALGELRGYGGVGDGIISVSGVKRIRVQNII